MSCTCSDIWRTAHWTPSGPTPHELGCPDGIATATDAQFRDYQRATIALRDAELALRTAQENYRRALEALNKAIAPIPEK